MEKFSAFHLILMLTGPFISSNIHSSPAPVISSFVSPDKAGGSSEEVLLVEGTSLRIKAFCGHQHLKGEKVWCKEKLKEECYHNAPLSFPGSGWKYLTTESSQWIILEGSANDCISLIMPSLQVEDSGIYWFGILNHATFISLEKINVVIHKSPSTPTKTNSPPTSTLHSSGRNSKEGKVEEEVIKMQGESLKIDIFCSQLYLQTVKMWCKGELLKECNPTEPVTLSKSGWKYLTTEPSQRILLKDSRNGCFSLLMSALQVEDSGIYWFGILDDLNVIPLRKIRVTVQKGPSTPTKNISPPTSTLPSSGRNSKEGKVEEEVIKMQGESLKIDIFCSQLYLQTVKMWCKGELLKECNPTEPVTLSKSGWKYLTTEPNQRILLKDSRNGCFSLLMSALQVEDSGIYWFGILDDLNVIPLRKIRVTVQKGQLNDNSVTPTAENHQRAYQVTLVLGSIVVGITIIASLTLAVTMLIKNKARATEDLNFDDNPNCRIITLQICESNATSNPPGKERNIAYAILKSPRSMTEDSTYVNTKFPPKSSLNKHPSDQAPGMLSGSVKYANIIFGSRVLHMKE